MIRAPVSASEALRIIGRSNAPATYGRMCLNG